jgi:hypothetical protein
MALMNMDAATGLMFLKIAGVIIAIVVVYMAVVIIVHRVMGKPMRMNPYYRQLGRQHRLPGKSAQVGSAPRCWVPLPVLPRAGQSPVSILRPSNPEAWGGLACTTCVTTSANGAFVVN